MQVDGAAVDWDAARGSVTLGDVAVRGGRRALRRAVRRGAEVTLRVTGATRVVVEDADGGRSRVTAAARLVAYLPPAPADDPEEDAGWGDEGDPVDDPGLDDPGLDDPGLDDPGPEG